MERTKRAVPIRFLPEFLSTAEALQGLIQLLLEKEKLRRSLKARDFGPRITDPEQARLLLARVIRETLTALNLREHTQRVPRLVHTTRISRLPRQIVILYLMFLPITLWLLYLSLSQPGGSPALWMVRGAAFTLLAIPLLVYRRARLNIEHGCGYVRDSEGQGVIVIDQLPLIQFQSYLAHEYAHHLYCERFGAHNEEWLREGWARLVQWQMMQHFCRLENDPAYLYHALLQIIGELKFACQLISKKLRKRLPREVKRIPSIYRLNPLLRLLTGTPGFSTIRLLEHAVGTARFFLAAQRFGPQEALRNSVMEDGWMETSRTPRYEGLSTKHQGTGNKE